MQSIVSKIKNSIRSMSDAKEVGESAEAALLEARRAFAVDQDGVAWAKLQAAEERVRQVHVIAEHVAAEEAGHAARRAEEERERKRLELAELLARSDDFTGFVRQELDAFAAAEEAAFAATQALEKKLEIHIVESNRIHDLRRELGVHSDGPPMRRSVETLHRLAAETVGRQRERAGRIRFDLKEWLP